MRKTAFVTGFTILSLVIALSLASAAYAPTTYMPSTYAQSTTNPSAFTFSGNGNSYNPNYYNSVNPVYTQLSSSSYGSNYSDFAQYPVSNSNSFSASASSRSNFDSTNFYNAYQGPVVDKTTTYNEYLDVRPNGRVIRLISASTQENNVGAKQLITNDAQNRQLDQANSTSSSNSNYNGGFSWSNKNSFDRSAYSNTNGNDFYYAPTFDSNLGYYNWRY